MPRSSAKSSTTSLGRRNCLRSFANSPILRFPQPCACHELREKHPRSGNKLSGRMTQPDKNNLLLALVGFAQQQYENFITEVFAHLLRHLLMHDPKVAREVLKKLTGNRLRLDSHTCADVKIDTQTEFPPHGRPDIVIRMPRQLVIVEVKVDAEVSPG